MRNPQELFARFILFEPNGVSR